MAAEQSEKPLDTKTRDALTEGLIDLLKPSVEEIDDRVRTVRYSICSVIHPRCILKKGAGQRYYKNCKIFLFTCIYYHANAKTLSFVKFNNKTSDFAQLNFSLNRL